MEVHAFLQLRTLFKYLNANPDSRCVVEGEQVLNANHIILCGIKEKAEDVDKDLISVQIIALCLQTSALNEKPHEIIGKFNINVLMKDVEITGFSCSCKAGLSGTCKHISAVLLSCTRSDILSFEHVSSTDVECYWGKSKGTIKTNYAACPILETECLKRSTEKKRKLSLLESDDCFKILMNSCKKSALFKHLSGRESHMASTSKTTLNINDCVTIIMDNVEQSTFLVSLEINVDSFNLRDCCTSIINNLKQTNVEDIFSKVQGSDEWKEERKFRLTGSRCYSIYTYTKLNWHDKANKYFWPRTFTNKYVRHGIVNEKFAMSAYKNATSYDIYVPGFLVCKRFAWLGYSADGIVMVDGQPKKLLEIKCPYIGIEEPAKNFINHLKYIKLVDGVLQLKKCHSYYGQVQLGMALLNLSSCDFIIYSTKSESFVTILVEFDHSFAKKLIEKISKNYLTYMLHTICEKKEEYY